MNTSQYGGALFISICAVAAFTGISICECIYRKKNKDTDPFIGAS